MEEEEAEEEETKEPSKGKKKKVAKPAAQKAEQSQKAAAEKKTSKPAGKAEPKGKAAQEAPAPVNKHAKIQPVKIMMNEPEAKKAVAEYMQSQNRPYSLQNVMDNLHGRIPRKICEKVLDDLAKENHLVCKEFGKAKIYLANQDNFPVTSNEQLAELDKQISEKKGILDGAKDRLKQLQAQLKDVTSTMTN